MFRMVIRGLHLVLLGTLVAVSPLSGQPASPAQAVAPPKALYTPRPVYRPEWAKQGLSGKGVALVTIDNKTGKVLGVRMVDSTGNKLLDGAALEAYSQWRFQPGTGSQVRIPIEFVNRRNPEAARRAPSKPSMFYGVLIVLGNAIVAMFMRGRRRAG